jgi:hypothetical protein
MLNPFSFRMSRLFLGLLGLGVLAGCNGNVAWLPDSSGFVVWAGQDQGRVMHYDLASHSAHLVRDNCVAFWPAISADGKQAITADVIYRKPGEPITLQVFGHTLDGKEAWHSQELNVGKSITPKSKEAEHLPAGIFVDPGGDRLLITTIFSEEEPVRWMTFAYSIKGGQAKAIPDVVPWPILYGSPLLPGGKGVLATSVLPAPHGKRPDDMPDPRAVLSVMAWDGVAKSLRSADGKELDIERINKVTETSFAGDVLTLHAEGGVYRIDTGRLTWRFAAAAAPAAQPNAVVRRFTFPGTGVRVECSSVKVATKEAYRIETVDPRSGVRQIVLPNTAPASGFGSKDDPIYMIFPSPDQKKLAVRYRAAPEDADCVLVIGEDGKVIEPQVILTNLLK